jgi:hypothetical protein
MIQEVTIPGAEACKKSLCSSRTLANIALVAGDQIPALHVKLVHVLLLSVQTRRAGMALCEAINASILVISSQLTPALALALLPLEALQALGMTLTGQALACLQCPGPDTRLWTMNKNLVLLKSNQKIGVIRREDRR